MVQFLKIKNSMNGNNYPREIRELVVAKRKARKKNTRQILTQQLRK